MLANSGFYGYTASVNLPTPKGSSPMETKVHPTFSKTYHQTMLWTWVASLASLAIGFWLMQRDILIIGVPLGIGFVVIIAVGILRMRSLLQRVTCWECGGPTHLHANQPDSTSWAAVCEPCQITWDLQAQSRNYT